MAHRGGAGGGLENAMSSFARAVALGYRYVETDVRATADGELLTFHDDTLDRVTDSRGAVARLPWSQVRRARIAGLEPVPRLADILEEWPYIHLNVDVKAPNAVGPLVALMRRTGAGDRLCVGSFSGRRLHAVRRALGPAFATSLSPGEVARLWAGVAAGAAPARVRRAVPRVACAQVPPRVGGVPLLTRRFVDTAHGLGLDVHAWTINDVGEMERLLDLGVDGIVTDELEALREVLRARSVWG